MLLHSLFEQGVSSNSWQQGIFVSNKHRDRFIRGDGIFLTASLCLVTLVCGEDCTIAKHSLSRHSIPRLGFPAVTAYTDFGRVSDEHPTKCSACQVSCSFICPWLGQRSTLQKLNLLQKEGQAWSIYRCPIVIETQRLWVLLCTLQLFILRVFVLFGLHSELS